MASKKLKKARTGGYVPARVRVALSPGDAVRVARELQEMTQAELGAACGIPQGTISSIEKRSCEAWGPPGREPRARAQGPPGRASLPAYPPAPARPRFN